MNKLTEDSAKNGYKATCNHYRKLVYPLFLTLLVLLLTSSVQAKYSGGTGEPNSPYLIATPNDLNSIGADSNDWDKHFKMTADINLAGITYTTSVIAPDTSSRSAFQGITFTGVFDGNDHNISNLNITGGGVGNGFVGLFGFVNSNGVIKNLVLENVLINCSSKISIGSLAGYSLGTIYNCYVKGGKIIGDGYIAGLAGANHGVISNSYVQDANVAGEGIVGAIAGMNANGLIHKCWANGFIQGNCRIGGLVGVNKGFIQNSYTICDVNCESIGGGLVGENARSISHCYATGQVDGVDDTGAFAGINVAIYEYDKCFWNSDINPTLPGLGQGTDPNVIGLIMSQMQKKSTFTEVSWDFVEIWNIGENQTYPYLRIYPAGDLNHDGVVNLPDFAIFADHWLAGVE